LPKALFDPAIFDPNIFDILEYNGAVLSFALALRGLDVVPEVRDVALVLKNRGMEFELE